VDENVPEQVANLASQPPPLPEPPAPRALTPCSTTATIILAVMLVGAFAFRNWPYLTKSRMSTVSSPEHTALFVVHYGMLFHEGTTKLPKSGKTLLGLIGAADSDIPIVCEKALRESISHLQTTKTNQASVDELRAHLTVLLAESGSMTNAQRELGLLDKSGPAAAFKGQFESLYATNKLRAYVWGDPETNLLSGWAAWRFTARWLNARGDQTNLTRHEVEISSAERTLLSRDISVFFTAWLVQVAGFIVLAVMFFSKSLAGPICPTVPNPDWTAAEVWGLFVRAFLLGIVLEYATIYIPVYGYYAWVAHCFVFCIPTIALLLSRHWIRNPISFRQFFGLPGDEMGIAKLICSSLVLFAICWFTLTWVPRGIEALGFKSHWSESIDEVLFMWPTEYRVIRVMDGVIFGPLLEEIVFRGLLFGALRMSMPAVPAAAVSSIAFGVNHFYSLPGFLGVTAFGFWCAMAREKTGSLVPGILVHMLTNLFLIGGEAWVTSSVNGFGA
jgi:membrane protease YdiL (CAAX protease family)